MGLVTCTIPSSVTGGTAVTRMLISLEHELSVGLRSLLRFVYNILSCPDTLALIPEDADVESKATYISSSHTSTL